MKNKKTRLKVIGLGLDFHNNEIFFRINSEIKAIKINERLTNLKLLPSLALKENKDKIQIILVDDHRHNDLSWTVEDYR